MYKSSAHLLLHLLRELALLGHRNLRFYSYQRWNFRLMIVVYEEMPLRARTGEALTYGVVFSKEYSRDFSPAYPDELDQWANSELPTNEIAVRFLKRFLRCQAPIEGCYASEYYPWLDHIIDCFPEGLFPLTEEPFPPERDSYDEQPDMSVALGFYPLSPAAMSQWMANAQLANLPLPPGMRGAIDPFEVFRSEMKFREKSRREMDAGPTGFGAWSKKQSIE